MRQSQTNPVKAAVRSQQLYAWGIMAVGLGFIVAFAAIGVQHMDGLTSLAPMIVGGSLIAFARHTLIQVGRRKHGMTVEARAIAAAIPALKKYGVSVSPNVQMRGLGDIDMVVTAGASSLMPVEIKSFQSWGAPHQGRCDAAVEQVTRAQHALHAPRAYIWLPDAKVGLWRRWFGLRTGPVTVSFGSAKNLARIIRRQER